MSTTPAPGTLAAVLADLETLHSELEALRTSVAAAADGAEQVAARIAVIEQITPAAPAAAPAGQPYRYQALPDWVDEVFARLATTRRAKWCTNWSAHLEAHARLEVLWHTWEAAWAAAPGTDPAWAAVDDWLRLRLDHHTAVLLDVDGPFAGCVPARGADPGRCAITPALAQRPLVVAHSAAVAQIGDPARAARLAALHASRSRRPAGARA